MSGGSQKLFQGMDQGAFGQAQKFANQGQWGQAAQAYQRGGGQFGQPQMQAFSQQYGNANPFSKPGSAFDPTFGLAASDPNLQGVTPFSTASTGPTQWAGPNAIYPNWNDAPGGFSNDVALLSPPSAQAQPMPPMNIPGLKPMSPQQAAPMPSTQTTHPPPAQMRPLTPTAPQMPMPGFGPGTRPMPAAPNWASYVQGNPDLMSAYNQGSPQSIGDWGQQHWNQFGQNESRSVNPFSGGLLSDTGYGEHIIYD